MSLPALQRVLVVDDQPFIRQTVKSMLRRIGQFEIEEASDGDTALAMLSTARPDLVMCDIRMQPMDGFEFLEQVRRHKDAQRRATRIVLLTADARQKTLDQALLLKPDGYLVKPVSPGQITEVLRTLFDWPEPG